MLRKIFKPRWQHRKEEVRIAAVKDLASDDPILLQLAGEDEAPAVRRHALRRIKDVQSLARLFLKERDEAVRESVGKRLKRVLAGEEENIPDSAMRCQLLAELGDEDVLAYVLRHAEEVELRQFALESVTRPSLLADVALSDPSGELRLSALERIERPATLERVAKEAKGKDKRVARRARERLDTMRIEVERPARQAEICDALDRLAGQGGVDLVAFKRMQKAWRELLPPASHELEQRFDDSCRAFEEAQSRLQEEAALATQQRTLCERAEALQKDVEQPEVDFTAIDNAVIRLRQDWQELEAEQGQLNPTLAERFQAAMAGTVSCRKDKQAEHEDRERLQRLLDELDNLIGGKGSINSSTLRRFEARWHEAGGDRTEPYIIGLDRVFRQKLQQAGHRLNEQGQERERLQATVSELLVQLESALDDGKLQQANSFYDRVRNRLERFQELGGKLPTAQLKRWQKAVSRLREMRDWRRFGTDRAREELLEQMNALSNTTLPPLKLAEEIKALRDNWRALDRKGGPPGESMSQAFDQAAETAYAPCLAYYEAERQQRQEHLAVRERFLDELEQAYNAIDWQAPDWAEVEQRLQNARKQWPKMGGVEHKEWKGVNGRFREIVDRFETQLRPQRERETMRREGLITRVERLTEESDLERALSETKAAQAAWRPIVSASPRIEQKLWRRFKAACDAIYARQRAQVQATREAERADYDRLEQLCVELEGLAAGLVEDELARRQSRLSEIKSEWAETDRSSSRRYKFLASRFDAAQKAFAQAERAIGGQRREAEQRLLQEKAELCEAIEAQLFATPLLTEVERLETAWQALPALKDRELEHSLENRFSLAQKILNGGKGDVSDVTTASEENLARGQSLCLQLELLVGVDSPDAFAEQRLAMQVEMLSEAMTGQLGVEERDEMAHQLLREYFAIGPVQPAEREQLSSRLQAVFAGLSSARKS